VDPDSKRGRGPHRRQGGRVRRESGGAPVTVTDGRGRSVRDGGLARWLAPLVPSHAGDIGIALVSDRRVRTLNGQYRGKDTPTDVLSFPSADDHRAMNSEPPIPEGDSHLGDIVIATGVARRQAHAAGHAYGTELRVLALHGLLHLLGYDHDDPRDRGRMARAEARLRRKGGLNEGLIARNRPRRGHRQRPR
jgi:probable rRNA maturation factor